MGWVGLGVCVWEGGELGWVCGVGLGWVGFVRGERTGGREGERGGGRREKKWRERREERGWGGVGVGVWLGCVGGLGESWGMWVGWVGLGVGWGVG